MISCQRFIQPLLENYVTRLIEIYGSHIKSIILYGSYTQGDYTEDSDIDIMTLLDISDIEIKKYRHQFSGMTYDFNTDYDLDIKSIAKIEKHLKKWLPVYPFYSKIEKEGIYLYQADSK